MAVFVAEFPGFTPDTYWALTVGEDAALSKVIAARIEARKQRASRARKGSPPKASATVRKV